MKRKLLFAATLVVGALAWNTAMAQTDVTDQYLYNADFEKPYTVYSYPTSSGDNKRAIYQPEGWQIDYSGANTNDLTCLKSGDLQYNSFKDKLEPENGQSYLVRERWGNSTRIGVKQTLLLPAGNYRLSASIAHYTGTGTTCIYVGATEATTTSTTWETKSIDFTSDGTPVTVGFYTQQAKQEEQIAGVDNFKLELLGDASAMGTDIDATSVIQNPDIESLSGWTTEFITNAGTTELTNLGFTHAPVAEKWFGTWVSNTGTDGHLNDYDLQQKLALPRGVYTLSAMAMATRQDNAELTIEGALLYATVGDIENTTSVGAIQTYNVDFKIIDKNASIATVGYKTVSTNANWVVVDDFTLKYVRDLQLSDIQPQIDALVSQANDLDKANMDNASELTALNNLVGAAESVSTVDEGFILIENLKNAIASFTAAKDAYDTYAAEKANADRISNTIATSVTTPTTADEAKTALKELLVAEYNYVLNNFNADVAQAYGLSLNQLTATAVSGNQNDTPGTNSNQKWGDAANTYYEQGSQGWGSSNWTINYSKTVTLPAGTYVLKLAARASAGTTATLKATIGETSITESLPNNGSNGLGINTSGAASFNTEDAFSNSNNGWGWQWRYLAFTLDADTEVTLDIDASASTQYQWCSFGDLSVMSNVNTEALKTAYNNFEMKTLGFEAGEYAPYNNVEVLTAYSDAGAIIAGTLQPSTQAAIDAMTGTLTNPSWTANAADVEAIYNGDFHDGSTGWHGTSWGAHFTDADATTTSNQTVWRYNPGSMQYGNEGVYTLPLKASTIYHLVFKYAAWDQYVTPTASVLHESDGMAAMSFAATSKNYKENGAFITVDMVFATGASGNYILDISGNANLVITDVSITKAANQYLEFADNSAVPTYAPGTYPTVKITRTLTANRWATAVYPFAVSGVNDIAVLDNYTAETGVLAFASAAASTANEPFLMRSTDGATEISLSNVAVAAAAVANATKGNAKLIGAYTTTNITSEQKNYVLSQNVIYPVGTAGATINPYRAYIQINQTAEVKALSFFVDGETTGIEALEEGQNIDNAEIFNLAGQRVNKAQKGIYIVGGKKVLVK